MRLLSDDQGLTVSVQDNGPGVPPEQQTLVFEKFRQGGEANHRPQGTGLGLPISRQIVEHFGGRMWLDSTPGQGATFSFWLLWAAATAQAMPNPQNTDIAGDTP
jgi:signal transduction histidine kinase